MKYAALPVALVLLAAMPAYAKPWTLDYAHSKLGFVGTQGSSTFEGGFKTFQASIDMDPDKPETGKITATIDMGSATAGSSERDSYLPQADWFNTKQFPEAQFVSTSIHKTGDHTYLAEGNLTIKGVVQPISLPFTLTQDGDHWHAVGKVTLIRSNFHVGVGQWANENYVKYGVDVLVDITANP